MLRKYQTSIGSFTRKSTFFWASVGATVGLANLWQFPYLASIHGGGLFILLYLACLLIVTLPLMVAVEAASAGCAELSRTSIPASKTTNIAPKRFDPITAFILLPLR